MARFALNPPGAAIGFATVGGQRVTVSIEPEWYRFFARTHDILGGDAVGAMKAAPTLTYSTTAALDNDKVLTQGAGLSFTSGATTLTVALSTTGVTAAAYGSASQVASFTVDAYGRLSAAANVTITPAAIGAVPTSRTITAGAGLTGTGDLSADRTLAVGAGTGITVNADDIALDTTSTRNTDHASVTLTAGAGLTGGGDISANRTFTVGAGTGITVNADDVAIDATVVATLTGAQTLTNKTFGTPPIFPEYTVAGVPSAATYDNGVIIVSNETGGRTLATSDGTNWRRVSDGAIVS